MGAIKHNILVSDAWINSKYWIFIFFFYQIVCFSWPLTRYVKEVFFYNTAASEDVFMCWLFSANS